MKTVFNLLSAVTATGAGSAFRTPSQFVKKAVVANIAGTSGAQTATVNIEVSNDGILWVSLTSLSLSGTSTDQKAYVIDGPFFYARANVTAITGTGAAVSATLTF